MDDPNKGDYIESHSCLAEVPMFARLNGSELKKITEIMRPARFKKGQMVQVATEDPARLLVMHSGQAKVFRYSPSGKEQILRILTPGSFIGEIAVFGNRPAENSIEAIEESTFCVLDGGRLQSLIAESPHLAIDLLADVSNRLAQAEQHIENISLLTAEQKVARELLSLSGESQIVDLAVSKRNLALKLNMSQEALSRQLTKLRQAEVIRTEGRHRIVIVDKLRLEQLSGG